MLSKPMWFSVGRLIVKLLMVNPAPLNLPWNKSNKPLSHEIMNMLQDETG
jgi:hypothetical protein